MIIEFPIRAVLLDIFDKHKTVEDGVSFLHTRYLELLQSPNYRDWDTSDEYFSLICDIDKYAA